jgi:hypothetical protein
MKIISNTLAAMAAALAVFAAHAAAPERLDRARP